MSGGDEVRTFPRVRLYCTIDSFQVGNLLMGSHKDTFRKVDFSPLYGRYVAGMATTRQLIIITRIFSPPSYFDF